MSDEVKTTAEETTQEGSHAKESIYEQLAALVQEKTGKRVGKSGGRELFDIVIRGIFLATVKEGSFRFNGGFGSLRLKQYGAGERRLPSGQVTKFGERLKVRYDEGSVTQRLTENGGDYDAIVRENEAKAGKAAPTPVKVSVDVL